MKKILFVVLILVVLGTSAFAFDIKSFPSPIQKKDLLISPTFNLGRYYWRGATIGATIGIDYALPINFALTVGGEAGFAFPTSTYYNSGYGSRDTMRQIAIPIMVRAAWHPNFEVPNLDVYAIIKLGMAIGLLTNKPEYYKGRSGFAGGGNVGVRYFFGPKFGLFGELGWDSYNVGIKYTGPYSGYWYSPTLWMGTFFHLGITFKV